MPYSGFGPALLVLSLLTQARTDQATDRAAVLTAFEQAVAWRLDAFEAEDWPASLEYFSSRLPTFLTTGFIRDEFGWIARLAPGDQRSTELLEWAHNRPFCSGIEVQSVVILGARAEVGYRARSSSANEGAEQPVECQAVLLRQAGEWRLDRRRCGRSTTPDRPTSGSSTVGLRFAAAPDRVLLATSVVLHWKANSSVLEYRYRLDVPGQWLAGLPHLVERWSAWGALDSVQYRDFVHVGTYRLTVQARHAATRESRGEVSHEFEVFFEWPEILEADLELDWSDISDALRGGRFDSLAREFEAAHRAWLKKLDYELRLVRSTVDAGQFVDAILTTASIEAITAEVQGARSSSSLRNLGKRVLGLIDVADIARWLGADALLIWRRLSANRAATMALFTYFAWQASDRLAKGVEPVASPDVSTPPPRPLSSYVAPDSVVKPT